MLENIDFLKIRNIFKASLKDFEAAARKSSRDNSETKYLELESRIKQLEEKVRIKN